MRCTRKHCPTDLAIIERTQKTITAQALLGQTYTSHTDLWASLDERREVLNHYLPSRALSHKPALEAYPGAIHSGRFYRPEWEEELLSLKKVCTYLAQGRWFRGVRSNGFFGGGRYQYYLGKHSAQHRVALRFDPEAMALICLPEGSEETIVSYCCIIEEYEDGAGMNEEYMHINQQRWNEMVGVHEKSAFYDMAGFKAGRNTVAPLEREELGNVAGKSLLHLQCHFGMDTMSWARLGAKVTGVDYSERAIELAQSLAKELAIDAHFVRSNIYDLPNDTLIPDTFDIVYTALGVLGWLPDLKHWGKVIAHYLKPGGTFYILEAHPFMLTLDENSSELKVVYPYFSSEALKFDSEHSYADSVSVLTNKTEYGWNHSLSDIFNALLSEGLSINFFHEFPFCGWPYFSDMEKGEDGWSRFKDERKRKSVPLMFSLKATKK